MTVTWPDPTPSFYASLENARRRFNEAAKVSPPRPAKCKCFVEPVLEVAPLEDIITRLNANVFIATKEYEARRAGFMAEQAFIADGGDIEEIYSIERAFLGSVLDVEQCMTDYLTECASERSEDEEDA